VTQGDRSLLVIARSVGGNPEVLKLVESYEHINEFVCATFACDMKKMMNVIALGGGEKIFCCSQTLFV
jgi:hypothetical protein